MTWVRDYSEGAAATDALSDRAEHRALLAAGLFGEAGSIAAEVKKMAREGAAYPAYQKQLTEEVGDFLWYLVRLASVYGLHLESDVAQVAESQRSSLVAKVLHLGAAIAPVLAESSSGTEATEGLEEAWGVLQSLCVEASIDLQEAAQSNLKKIDSRWPSERIVHGPFDEFDPVEDQLPRELSIEFREAGEAGDSKVVLRYGRIGIGDRITDNIEAPDAYRYHDVFHIAYATFLGWSPVLRALLRCKRKSRPDVDRDQDGARAVIIEEAISATVFGRAKEMDYFASARSVDYDLLKTVQRFTAGYEVDQVPLWQWEQAILEGYHVFRQLRDARRGRVSWDLIRRKIAFEPFSC